MVKRSEVSVEQTTLVVVGQRRVGKTRIVGESGKSVVPSCLEQGAESAKRPAQPRVESV